MFSFPIISGPYTSFISILFSFFSKQNRQILRKKKIDEKQNLELINNRFVPYDVFIYERALLGHVRTGRRSYTATLRRGGQVWRRRLRNESQGCHGRSRPQQRGEGMRARRKVTLQRRMGIQGVGMACQ